MKIANKFGETFTFSGIRLQTRVFEEELMDILRSINQKICDRICGETGVPPILLFQKEKEYLKTNDRKKRFNSHIQ